MHNYPKFLNQSLLVFIIPPLVVVGFWAWIIYANVYGHPLGFGILFLLIGGVCVFLSIAYGIAALLHKSKRSSLGSACFYWVAMLMLMAGLGHITHRTILWGIVLRVEKESQFSTCKESAKEIPEYGYFNICEEQDVTQGLIPLPHFRYIVYDPNIVTTAEFCRKFNARIQEGRPYSFLDSPSCSSIRNITDHFYLIDNVFGTSCLAGTLCGAE